MKKKKINIDKINLLFVLPAMLIVFLLLIYPIFSSIYFSFTSKNLIRPYYKWIWFDNFKFVLTNPEFYHAFLNSIKWTILSITGQLLVGFIAALSLNRIPKFSGFYIFRFHPLLLPTALCFWLLGYTFDALEMSANSDCFL